MPFVASVGVVKSSESLCAVTSDTSVMIAGSSGALRDTVDAIGVLNGFSGSGVMGMVVSFSRSSMATPSSDDGTM